MIDNPRRGRENYAPDYAFASLAGDYVSSKELIGKTVLLDFWGTWCGPCRAATPDLVRLHKKYRDGPFEMIGISSDKPDDKEKWVEYIAKTKMEWPQYPRPEPPDPPHVPGQRLPHLHRRRHRRDRPDAPPGLGPGSDRRAGERDQEEH